MGSPMRSGVADPGRGAERLSERFFVGFEAVLPQRRPVPNLMP